MADKVFIGETLIRLRKAKHLSQLDVARLTGLRQGFLSELESNKKEPGAGTLIKLSHVLGVSIDDLLQTNRDAYLKNIGKE